MTSHRSLVIATVLLSGVLVQAPAAQAASLSRTDRETLVSTAQGATYELAVAKLALVKASSSQVKSYAHTMISDHTRLDPKVHQLASQNQVELPTTMTDEKQQSYDHLVSLNGKAFDLAFVKAETEDNKSDISSEQKEIQTTGNTQIKDLVQQLQQADGKHAKIGEELQQVGK